MTRGKLTRHGPGQPRAPRGTPASPAATGASRGLGRALAHELAEPRTGPSSSTRRDGAPARGSPRCRPAARTPGIAGDVTDPAHRRDLVDVAAELGGASAAGQQRQHAGPSPLPAFAESPGDVPAHPPGQPGRPVALTAALLPRSCASRRRGAQPQLGRLGRGLRDLGRLRLVQGRAGPRRPGCWPPRSRPCACTRSTRATCAPQMHQDAFPGEDISDRPEPEAAVPALLRLLEGGLPSGRYRAVRR